MAGMRIDLLEHVGLGLILAWPSGVVISNQTGGTSNLSPELEGVFVPLRNYRTHKGSVLISPENELFAYFARGKWGGSGATEGIEADDAEFIETTIGSLFPTIRVDRDRLAESHEAWVHVKVFGDEPCGAPLFSGFAPYPRAGVLTWQNSD